MPDNKMIPTNPAYGDRAPLPAEQHHPPAPAYGQDPYYPDLEPEMEGLDWRRYVHSLVRYKWLIVVALLLGAGASYWVYQTTPVEYRAQGTLWIEDDGGRFQPLQQDGAFESTSWIELLRSFSVLDSVVVEQRMHISAPREHGTHFASLKITDRLEAGAFELRIDANGTDFTLTTPEEEGGDVLERGQLGEAVGASLGFDWRPPVGAFAAGEVIPFSVRRPRDVSGTLAGRLDTGMDRAGNFLEIRYTDTSAGRAARIVNALMERHVAVAEELRQGRLRQRLMILEEQLRITESQLFAAEQAYEVFRVNTITTPTVGGGAAGGLSQNTNPVFENFLENRIRQSEIADTRARLGGVLSTFEETSEVRIEALEMIPETANSSELRRAIDDLIDARAQRRALSDRYTPDHPAVQDLEVQIESIETSIANSVQGIASELGTTEQSLSSRVASQSAELREIPPVAIEERRLARSVQITEELHNDLRSRVEEAQVATASSIPEVKVLDEAQVPSQPLADNRLRLVFMIMAGCLGAAVLGAVLLDQTDAKFRYASDIGKEMGLDILGSIPRLQSGRSQRDILNAAQALEAFRELRMHVDFAYGAAGPITVAVTSPAAGEGKSLISSNLAVSFAEVGRRTLLIDGDTRRGDAHRLLGLSQSPGLIDHLKGTAREDVIQKSEHDNLDFIGCGPRGASTPELLASRRMAEFIGTLKQHYDVIIVDCPPLAAGGDALILGTLTGNLAVVIRTGSTEKYLTQAKLAPIHRLPIRLLGAVLNDVDPSDGYHQYYSSYLPGYEAGMVDEEEGALLSDGRG
ncbi:MAG: polysaccharide biosynthesis tyrosine autokinase [Gemmatimonadetes bacterium]|nr:polysaccharide biosynthesis tyrosine autokinase [Gemmatimonadota bacterium]